MLTFGSLIDNTIGCAKTVPFLLNISTLSSRKTVNDDVRPATECAKPDPLAKLFVPLHFPERSNLSELVRN
jgi:hypothetical protein